jgi:hypothetical protein
MRIRFKSGLLSAALTLSVGLVLGQDTRNVRFRGVIHDYGPSTISGGPYELRGDWTLEVQRSGTANFTADLAMETSDYGISDSTQVDPTNPSTRNPHTHHISLTSGAVSYDASVCPANNPATTTVGVVVTGTAVTTANGSPAPFESKGPSTLQVCVTGGSTVSFSNLSLVYTGPATSHFGTQAIHGVVTAVATK